LQNSVKTSTREKKAKDLKSYETDEKLVAVSRRRTNKVADYLGDRKLEEEGGIRSRSIE